MDDSPIPRCIFKRFVITVCLILTILILVQININTYAAIEDANCFNFTSAFDFEEIGMAHKDGIAIIPLYCYAFFALKNRKHKTETKIIAPPSCRYAKILNC